MTTMTNNQQDTLVSTQIKITWKAFGNKPERNRVISSVEVKADKNKETADEE